MGEARLVARPTDLVARRRRLGRGYSNAFGLA
jgi:hypothetical protein